VAILSVALAVVWSVVTRRELTESGATRARAKLEHAEAGLRHYQELVDAKLRTNLQLLAEDPRLKSTLATRGIDAASVADVLIDVRTQSGLEILGVLGPDGRTMAVMGVEQYRGADLSASPVVRKADLADGVVSGLWVTGDRVVHIVATTLRLGQRVIAFVVAGTPLESSTLQRLHQTTDVGMGLVVDGRVTRASAEPLIASLALAATETTSGAARALSTPSGEFLAAVSNLDATVPQVRMAYLSPHEPLPGRIELLLWLPGLAAALAAYAWVGRALFR
jgi:hypothetical protein